MIRRTFRARHAYKCAGCRVPILPNTRYVRAVLPPWENMYEPDVDDEGRTFGVLIPPEERHWMTFRLHLDCGAEFFA